MGDELFGRRAELAGLMNSFWDYFRERCRVKPARGRVRDHGTAGLAANRPHTNGIVRASTIPDLPKQISHANIRRCVMRGFEVTDYSTKLRISEGAHPQSDLEESRKASSQTKRRWLYDRSQLVAEPRARLCWRS